MKTKLNQLPQLSLLTLSLGFGHSALATECISNNKNSFEKLNNVKIEQCNINLEINDSNRFYDGALNIKNSKDVTVGNSEINFYSKDKKSLSAIELDNSTVSFNNINLTVSSPYGGLNNGINARKSNISIKNSSLTLAESEGQRNVNVQNSTLFVENSDFVTNNSSFGGAITVENSNATIRNTRFNTNGSAELISSEGISFITLENVTGNNSHPTGELLTSFNGTANYIINNSTLSGGIGISTWWHADGNREEINFNLILNNSSFNTNIITYENDPKDEFYEIENINITTVGSTLTGAISATEKDNGKSHTTVNMTLTDSHWKTSPFVSKDLTVNNYVSNLVNNNSEITLVKTDNFQTLKVGNLTGNGTFVLNTDLANEKSDQIVVNGKAEGSHKLDIKDSGNEPKAPNGKVTLVKATQASEATFKLFNRDYVDAGAYRYRLHQQGYDWILSNNANEKSEKPAVQPTPIAPVNPTTPADTSKPVEPTKPVAPTETVQPSEPAKPVVPADITKPTDTATTTPIAPQPAQPDDHPAVQKMLSETSNTLVSLRQAQLQLTELELSGIHQRLGKLKTAETGNVWVRNHNARQERKAQRVSSDSLSSGFKQDTTLLQIGADTAISDNWRAGGFVGTSRSDIDFNGEYGKGKLKGVNLGLYATFQAQNGIYADNIVKFDRLRTSGDGVASQRYNGYTLSSEIGKAFAFGEGWTVTPQAQLAWTHLSSGDNVESLSALTSRAGVRVSKAIALANGNITPFIEVNGIHTHNRHSQVRVSQSDLYVKGAGSRIETAAGVSANFANHRLGVQLSTAHGSHLKQPLAVQVNYRYSW